MDPIFHLLPDAPKPVTPYSHAVEAGPFIFVTGQLATDPDDDALPLPPGIEAQTRKVMDNLSRVLRGCGLGFSNVVCVRIFLTDFNRDYAAMNAIFSYAARIGAKRVTGRYIPTAKNAMVKNFFGTFGFEIEADEGTAGVRWALDVDRYEPREAIMTVAVNEI